MFAFGDALGKFIVATYSVGQLMLLRACAALALLAPSMWRHRARIPADGAAVVAASAGRCSRPSEIAAFFLATVYLPLADVVTYYLATPIFVAALSAILLREQVGWRRWSAILIGFAGVLIALRPSAQIDELAGHDRARRKPCLFRLASDHALAARDALTSCWRRRSFRRTLLFGIVVAPYRLGHADLGYLGLFVAAGAISVARCSASTARSSSHRRAWSCRINIR